MGRDGFTERFIKQSENVFADVKTPERPELAEALLSPFLQRAHVWSKGQAGVHLHPQIFKTLHLLHTQSTDLQGFKQVWFFGGFFDGPQQSSLISEALDQGVDFLLVLCQGLGVGDVMHI